MSLERQVVCAPIRREVLRVKVRSAWHVVSVPVAVKEVVLPASLSLQRGVARRKPRKHWSQLRNTSKDVVRLYPGLR